MSEWDPLPNAAHIDAVLFNLQAGKLITTYRPDIGLDAYAAAETALENQHPWVRASLLLAQDAGRRDAYARDWNIDQPGLHAGSPEWIPYRMIAWETTHAALGALVSWEKAGYLLALEPDHVLFLSKLGDHSATMLYPYVRAMALMPELVAA